MRRFPVTRIVTLGSVGGRHGSVYAWPFLAEKIGITSTALIQTNKENGYEAYRTTGSTTNDGNHVNFTTGDKALSV